MHVVLSNNSLHTKIDKALFRCSIISIVVIFIVLIVFTTNLCRRMTHYCVLRLYDLYIHGLV